MAMQRSERDLLERPHINPVVVGFKAVFLSIIILFYLWIIQNFGKTHFCKCSGMILHGSESKNCFTDASLLRYAFVHTVELFDIRPRISNCA